MNKIVEQHKKSIYLSLIVFCCTIFTALSLFINVFYSIILWPLLPNIAVNLLVFLISFIVSSIITLVRYKMKKCVDFSFKFVDLITLFYTSIFIVFNISTVVFKDVWNFYTILIIFFLSIVMAIIKKYLPIKNYLVRAIINYLVISIPYFIITLCFAGYSKGNQIIIVFSIYTLVFAVSNIVIFMILRAKSKAENLNKNYSKQFK